MSQSNKKFSWKITPNVLLQWAISMTEGPSTMQWLKIIDLFWGLKSSGLILEVLFCITLFQTESNEHFTTWASVFLLGAEKKEEILVSA